MNNPQIVTFYIDGKRVFETDVVRLLAAALPVSFYPPPFVARPGMRLVMKVADSKMVTDFVSEIPPNLSGWLK